MGLAREAGPAEDRAFSGGVCPKEEIARRARIV